MCMTTIFLMRLLIDTRNTSYGEERWFLKFLCWDKKWTFAFAFLLCKSFWILLHCCVLVKLFHQICWNIPRIQCDDDAGLKESFFWIYVCFVLLGLLKMLTISDEWGRKGFKYWPPSSQFRITENICEQPSSRGNDN